MKPTAIKVVISGQPEAARKAASKLASNYQVEGKVVRAYLDPKQQPETLPEDADVIIMVSQEKP
jgi:hypothetical protein